MHRLRRYTPPTLILLALLIAFRAWPSDRVLTSEASPLLNIESWEAHSPMLGNPATIYTWLSKSRILHSRGISDNNWTVSVYDIDDKSDRNIPASLAYFLMDSIPMQWQVCPDGRKILIDKVGRTDLHTLACVDLNGRLIREDSNGVSAGWLDSDRFVSWRVKPWRGSVSIRTTIHSINGPQGGPTERSQELSEAAAQDMSFESRGERNWLREADHLPMGENAVYMREAAGFSHSTPQRRHSLS